MTEDWLLLPGEEQPAKPAVDMSAWIKEPPVHVPEPQVSEKAVTVAKERSEARTAFAHAWSQLSTRQQTFLRALQHTGFSVKRAREILNTGVDKRTAIGRTAPPRWLRTDDNYRLVLEALKAEAVVQSTSRNDLLLRAHRIAEQAEAGEPVFGVDRENDAFKIIGHEKKLDTALRANEQLMKATKVLGADNAHFNGGGTGPALIIQVVQRDGALVDVTPNNVTIDLPAPELGKQQ